MRLRALTLAAALLGATALSAEAAPSRAATAAPLDRAAAVAAVQALQSRVDGTVSARWKETGPLPHRLSGFATRPYAGAPAAAATSFLADLGALFAFDPAELTVTAVEGTRAVTAVRFTRVVDGAPVEGQTVVVSLDPDGRATAVSGLPQPLTMVPRTHEIEASAAISAALVALGVEEGALTVPPTATHAVMAAGTEGHLVWRVSAAVVPLAWHMRVLVDAATGEVLSVTNDIIQD